MSESTEDSRTRTALDAALAHAKAKRTNSFRNWMQELRSMALIENKPVTLSPEEMVTLIDGFLPPHRG